MNISGIFERFIGKALMLSMLFLVMVVSCNTDEPYEYDDTEIWDAIEQLQHRLDSLEDHVAANVAAIQSMVSLGSIKAWDFDAETGKGVITLIDGKTITVDQTIKGYSLITVIQGEDGKYYWAVCKDGVSEPLMINDKMVPVTVTPALKISEDDEWMISVDGGATWIATGIAYETSSGEESGDKEEGGEPVQPQVSFFENVEVIDGMLVLTFNEGAVVKLAVVGEASITAAADTLWFSRHDMEKSVAVEMVNVKSFTITEKPEGWKARIEDQAYLFISAPENFTDYPAKGTVKVLALFDGGLSPEILSVEVVYERSFSMSLVNGEVAVELSEHTASDYNGYVLAGWKKDEYSDEAAVAWFNSSCETLEARQGTAAYKPADIIEDFSDAESYVIAAVPYLPAMQVSQGKLQYELSDIQTVKVEGNAARLLSVSDIGFDRATVNASLDLQEFYGGFMELEDWNNYGRDNFLETLETGGAVTCTVPVYNGPANGFPYGEVYNNMIPATEYVVWYIPYVEEGIYAAEDFRTYTFTTLDVTYSESVSAPEYEVTDVTVSGFTAAVTPASGAYKTYAAIVKASVIPATDVEIVRYLIDVDQYSSAGAVNTVSAASFSSEDDVYLLAVSLTEDGKYGTIVKEQVGLKELTFTDALGVEVTDIIHGVGDVTLELAFTGDPEEITYHVSTYMLYSDDVFQRLLALKQFGEASTVKVAKIGDGLKVSGLNIGAEYTFYAVVRDAEGNCSNMYQYDFIPSVSIDYVLSDSDDYEYGMPVLSGTKSGSMNSYTLTLDVDMPSTCVRYWLFKGDPEYFAHDVYTDSDKLVTEALIGTTVHETSETGLVYEYMNAASRIYMVWLDDKGEYHAIYTYNPNK